MKILVVGGGGREHAIIKKLKENPAVTEIFALPGNGGISADATCVPIGATDLDGIVQFVKEHPVDYAVVTPDDPLVLGCVDRLNEIGVPCFGPKQNAAVIEGSKAFAKDLMKKYHIPTARYETFSDLQAASPGGQGRRPGPGEGRPHLPDPGGGCECSHRYDGECQIWKKRFHSGH